MITATQKVLLPPATITRRSRSARQNLIVARSITRARVTVSSTAAAGGEPRLLARKVASGWFMASPRLCYMLLDGGHPRPHVGDERLTPVHVDHHLAHFPSRQHMEEAESLGLSQADRHQVDRPEG